MTTIDLPITNGCLLALWFVLSILDSYAWNLYCEREHDIIINDKKEFRKWQPLIKSTYDFLNITKLATCITMCIVNVLYLVLRFIGS